MCWFKKSQEFKNLCKTNTDSYLFTHFFLLTNIVMIPSCINIDAFLDWWFPIKWKEIHETSFMLKDGVGRKKSKILCKIMKHKNSNLWVCFLKTFVFSLACIIMKDIWDCKMLNHLSWFNGIWFFFNRIKEDRLVFPIHNSSHDILIDWH